MLILGIYPPAIPAVIPRRSTNAAPNPATGFHILFVFRFCESAEDFLDGFGETVVLSAGASKGPATLVSREPGELATIYLEKDITVIGKLETAADAVINIPTVSRIHAKIRKREGAYYLADLNSRNGTSVNGQLLKTGEDYLLEDEDEVDFAQARYIFLK